MKKYINKEVISYILMFLSFFLLSFDTNIYTRNILDLKSFGFDSIKYYLLWIGFSLSWIFIIMLVLYLFKRETRIKAYIIIEVLLNVLFCAQICYTQQLGKFMVLSDLFLAGEGLQYISSIFVKLNIGMVLTVLANIGIISGVIILNKDVFKKVEKKKDKDKRIINKKCIVVLTLLILVFRLSSYFSLGTLAKENSWRENYNPKNIYNNFTNPNASMLICGFYEYNFRAVYKYFYNLLTFDKTQFKNNVDKYNLIYGIEKSDNEYTGIFKDKNVIYIMMESIDSWIIDEETMPTLYKLKNEGINFSNRYSPFFNGGQTINSEFSLNTGLYAISDKDTIYDIDDVDYNYSIANMLKKSGYSVNSFHANTASFYNRRTFHKDLGYKRHYSALDLQKANLLDDDKNYYLDSNFLGDDYLFNLMTKGDNFFSFFTTYSAHLEYTESNKVYKDAKRIKKNKKWSDEEYIYRVLAHDTDLGIKKLIDKLDSAGKLDDTVLVFVADHYVYGYSDTEYVALRKDVINDNKELQNTPFIIWSKDIESMEVDSILDTADILPTMLNLLGIDYNPNMYMGTDVFSKNHDHFVWFHDGTYIKDKYATLSNEAILTKTNYNISKNKSILLTNYYGK